MERNSVPLVSIVIACHNEEAVIGPLVAELRRVLWTVDFEYEILLVDDGSRDRTWATIDRAAAEERNLRGVRLSRNFGQQAALLAGMSVSRGDAVVTMDADLQHPPALLPELVDRWRSGASVVLTKRTAASDSSRFKRQSSERFYEIFSRLTGVRLMHGSSDFRLLDRSVVDEILRLREGEFFLRGLIAWMGYRTVVIPYQAAARVAGTTKYTLRRMLRFASSGLVSFSVMPLRLGMILGLVTATAAFGELAYAVRQALLGRTVPGWASVVGVVTLLFGVQFILIGVIGEYLGRVHLTIKGRPPFLIEDVTTPATWTAAPPVSMRRAFNPPPHIRV